MHGHTVSGKLTNEKLAVILKKYDFMQSDLIAGLFSHKTRPLSFLLVVDDFGIKHVEKEYVECLIQVLQHNDYITTQD